MAEIRVDLEILCICGNELTAKNKYAGLIEIEPCEKCLDVARDEGYSQGEKEVGNG